MRIRTQCRECGLPFPAELPPGGGELPCPGCGAARQVSGEHWSGAPEGRVEICPLCGSQYLYRQKDVNRALGCALVVLGAAAAPWTFGLSLAAVLLLDLVLYYRLPQAVVCYRCDTVYRDARPALQQREFNLLKHDVVKYGKSWTGE